MAYTQTQADALRVAIASGVLTVRHGDVSTTYRSLDEMKIILADMEEALAGGRVRRTIAVFSDGIRRGRIR